MLRQIHGKEIIERDLGWFADKANGKYVVLDLGCGDGLYAYRQALAHPKQFYIAVDANVDGLQKLSTKIERDEVKNMICLQQSAEALPVELGGKVDLLVINYPWASLLEMIVKQLPNFTNVLSLVKPGGELEFTLTYSSSFEESMMQEYQLPELTADVIKQIAQFLGDHSFVEVDCRVDSTDEVKYITSWGKRINSKREREIWKIEAVRA